LGAALESAFTFLFKYPPRLFGRGELVLAPVVPVWVLALAALAALGFGIFFTAIDGAAAHDPAWTIAAARTGGVLLLAAAALWMRPALPAARGVVLVALLAVGCFDVLANSLYAVATTHGLLPLVAVAASLYSAVTVLLARFVLGEHLAPSQRAGVAVALTGVALIAVGS